MSTSVRCSDSEVTLGHLAERNSSRMSNDEKAGLKKGHNSYKEAGKGKLPDGMSRVKKPEKPWYKKRGDNISKLKDSTPEQQAKYIKTGKIK